MKVLVNGQARVVETGSTLGDLLKVLALPTDGLAVAVNLEVVPRRGYDDHALSEDDRIELVRAVGGG